MSLYVRVFTSFWTHRKTIRLLALIGDSAFWVPPRIWSYAAEQQPDGCFKDYTPEELALLIGYSSNAKALLEALVKVGFMDESPLRIHDWQQHNGYHEAYSARGKKGAAARWYKKNTDSEKDTEREKEASIARSNASRIQEASKPNDMGDLPARIKAVNLWYCEQMTHDAHLDSGLEMLWARWFEAGFSDDDFKRVFKMKRDLVTERGDHPGCLRLSNLLQPDSFREHLMIAKQEFKNGHSKTYHRPNPRLEGVSRNNAVNNYGEAAKRKLERQALEAANRQAPKAEGA